MVPVARATHLSGQVNLPELQCAVEPLATIVV